MLVALLLAVCWFFYGLIRFDACLDRINYDRALWHLCEEDQDYRPNH